jgi:DNA-binding NarL/FixJ family response regulator
MNERIEQRPRRREVLPYNGIRANNQPLCPEFWSLAGGRCEVVLLDLRILGGMAPDPVHGGALPPVVTQGSPSVRLLLDAARHHVAQGNLASVPAVLCYTQENSPRVHLSCLVAGAMGIVHKDDSLDRLGVAIDVVAAGGCVVSAEVATLIGLLADQRKLDVSESQAQVLALAGHGYSRERIATTLCISISTVDKHLATVRTACGNALSYTDLADAFGLRDLAPPDPRSGAKTGQRQRLRELSHRITRRQ